MLFKSQCILLTVVYLYLRNTLNVVSVWLLFTKYLLVELKYFLGKLCVQYMAAEHAVKALDYFFANISIRSWCVANTSGFIWVRLCGLETEGEAFALGGFGVILKTGYREYKCWVDKTCRVNTEYTLGGKRAVSFAHAEKVQTLTKEHTWINHNTTL